MSLTRRKVGEMMEGCGRRAALPTSMTVTVTAAATVRIASRARCLAAVPARAERRESLWDVVYSLFVINAIAACVRGRREL